MELSLLLLQKILTMLIMILMGFSLVKTKKVSADASQTMASICVNWLNPLSILNSFLLGYSPEKQSGLLLGFACSFAFMIVYIFIGKLLKKPLKLTDGEEACCIYSNAGNYIIPLVYALFGSEAIFYCSALITVQSLFLWTHGYYTVSVSKDFNIKKIFNRNLIAVFVGAIIFFCRIPVPTVVSDFTDMMTVSMTPVAMFMIGMLMAGSDLKKIMSRKKNYLICALRLIVIPLFALGLMKISGIVTAFPFAYQPMLILMMGLSGPVAVMITQLTAVHGSKEDSENVGSITVMSTIFSLVTIPVIVLLFQLVFG